jgi:spermidine/putrescine transport system ATP-binding protein
MSNTGIIDLDVSQVSKRYQQHGKTFSAVENLSLQVPRGAFCSILGPSGCGKTTLLRMIAGFMEPDEGDILIGGTSMRGVAPNKRPVNMVFQHLALFPMMSVAENVAYGLHRRGLKKQEIQHKVADMLARVGLPDAGSKRIDQLSGGQKQRVAIARSLVLDPTLLLLDEPLGALDLKLREHMKLELKQLQAQVGTTFVYITHDQSEALVMSDFIAVMNQGRIEQLGSPQDLYYRPQTAFVAGFVGNSNRLEAKSANDCTGDTGNTGGHGLARLTQGPLLRVDNLPASATKLELFIRPQSIALSATALPAQPYDNRLQGRISNILFDGANSTVQVQLDDSPIQLQAALPQNMEGLHRGATVQLGIAADQVQAFAIATSATATTVTTADAA